MGQATIKDIARELGISVSTVSRALRGHPDISKVTRRRVMDMAEQLEYQPNIIAQSLKNQCSNIIGVIVPQVKHYFFATIMSGVTDVAYKAGYTVMICQSNEEVEREALNTQAMLAQRAAGVLISVSKDTQQDDHFRYLLKQNVPIVFFDRVCETIDASCVVVDDYEGAFKATEHLIQKGYQRIAHIAGPTYLSIGKKRMDGYLDALKKHGQRIDESLIVHTGLNEEDGQTGWAALKAQCGDLPDAVFAVNDPVAVGVYQCLKKEKIKIPGQVALLGFSDNPIASLLEPALTTVHQPAYDMGKVATELLLRQIQSHQPYQPIRKVLKTELIVRDST